LVIEAPGLGVGCFMLDCSFERTWLKGLGMNRVMRVTVWVSEWVVAIAGGFESAQPVDEDRVDTVCVIFETLLVPFYLM
jgi:hypothetical protein